MNTERNDSELVSEHYRELEQVRAPEALNQKILAAAKREAGRTERAGGLLDRWTKPLAWAATVGLCLAIVVEVTRLPDSAVVPAAVEEPSIADEFVPVNQDVIDAAQTQAELQAGSVQTVEPEDLAQAAPVAAAPQRKLEKAVASPEAFADDIPEAEPEGPPEAITVQAKRNERQVANVPTTELAEETPEADARARQEVSDSGQSISLAPSASLMAVRADADLSADLFANSQCEEAARETADEWQLCIDDLQLAGKDAEAKFESELLKLKFPDK